MSMRFKEFYQITKTPSQVLEQLNGLQHLHNTIQEDVAYPFTSDRFFDPEFDVDSEMVTVSRMFDAARHALGVANRLPPSSRAKHVSRVLVNLNKIRGILAKIQSAVIS